MVGNTPADSAGDVKGGVAVVKYFNLAAALAVEHNACVVHKKTLMLWKT